MSVTVTRKTKTKSQSSSSRTRQPASQSSVGDEAKEESKIHGFFAPAKKRQREEPPTDQPGQVDYLHVITYNTDGLDDNFLVERTSEVCSIILGDSDLPDVVLLQEVVPTTERIFIRRFQSSGYRVMITGVRVENAPYFTQIFVKDRDNLTFNNSASRDEFHSHMGRDLCFVTGQLHSEDITVSTAHLESLSQHSDVRKEQFSRVLSQITSPSSVGAGLVVFGGDTNLREAEVKAIGASASQVSDAWILAGSAKDTRFTWDLQRNDNKQMDGPRQPQARYDRIYFTKSSRYSVSRFELLGTERMAEGVFPSDHFGVRCVLQVKCRPANTGAQKVSRDA